MKTFFFVLAVLLLSVFVFLFVGSAPEPAARIWGVNFSAKHAAALGLDWQETYLALLDDLGVRNLKVAAHWDTLNPRPSAFDFTALDWQMDRAAERRAEVLLVVGMKTPRWPECHVPPWAAELSVSEQQAAILAMLESVVGRYKDHGALASWQVENEPFFTFGTCPFKDDAFLKKEVETVRQLDSAHPITVSDSGEFSFWNKPAGVADEVGVTMYRKVWFKELNSYVTYPIPPVHYWRKAQLVDLFFGKKVVGVEVQAEPWGPQLLYDTSVEEQRKTMNPERFVSHIEYAKSTGLDTLYLWGGEWWYWMKEVQGEGEIWELARGVFRETP